jgi:hypothetical protein
MPYLPRLNTSKSLSTQDSIQLIAEMDTLRAELDDLRTKYAALLVKLDAETLAASDYVATCGLAAAQFTRT